MNYLPRPCDSCRFFREYKGLKTCGSSLMLRYVDRVTGMLLVGGISESVKCPGQMTRREMRSMGDKRVYQEEIL